MTKINGRPTIKKIAELAGVTHTTVSNVLNNSGRVGEKTRERVQEIADQLSYKPDVVAQGLVKRHLKIIGMIIPSFHDDFSHDVFLGIENYCKQLGYKVLVGLSNNQEEEEERLVHEFVQMKVAGLIILPSPNYWDNHPLYERLKDEQALPYVFYTRYPQSGGYNRVVCNDIKGGKLAVDHLINKGHQNIAFYNSKLLDNANDSLQKKKGYRDALEEAGITYDPALEVRSDMFSDTKAIVNWIHENKVTAMFVSTDYAAIGLIHQFQEAGLKIPDDVALVGYDDIRMSSMIIPQLTTIRVPKQELGIQAARILIDSKSIEQNDLEVLLEPILIPRGSS